MQALHSRSAAHRRCVCCNKRLCCTRPIHRAIPQSSVQSKASVTSSPGTAPSISGSNDMQSSLSAEQQISWQQCVVKLEHMGFSQLEAEQRIQRAFGWGAKAKSYWRHEKSQQPADPQQLQAVLNFLTQQLGMTEQQVIKVVKLFPEVLGCDVQQQLQGNVDKLQREWKLQGSVLTNAVLRNPALLGYNVDCEGNCAGECNRCWVRF